MINLVDVSALGISVVALSLSVCGLRRYYNNSAPSVIKDSTPLGYVECSACRLTVARHTPNDDGSVTCVNCRPINGN